VPIVIGEFGIPFDMNGGEAYQSGDFSRQAQALDYHFGALDDQLLNYTIWNYTADNSNARGDMWNGEDLSIFSRDQQQDPADINSGGRALAAIVRPYARKIAGEPLAMRFEAARGAFSLRFQHDNALTAPTEIFLPKGAFPGGYRVEVSDGDYEIQEERQRLLYRPGDQMAEHNIRILAKNPPTAAAEPPYDKLALVGAALVFALAFLRRLWRRGKQNHDT